MQGDTGVDSGKNVARLEPEMRKYITKTTTSAAFSQTGVLGFPYFAPGCTPGAWAGTTYQAPTFFPIRPFHMVLGVDQANPCVYIPDCEAFSRGDLEWPEGFVIEVLIATLGDCPLRKCHVLDLGGNLGYVNSYAGSLGAKVVSVEPQSDLAAANKATTEHNCWQHRVENIVGFLTLSADEDKHDHKASQLWRPGMTEFNKTREATKVYLGRLIEQLGSKHLDLVKIDVDSIDIPILKFIVNFVKMGDITVDHILIEAACEPETFFELQQLGYNIFQLDHHLRARFFDARGRDVYKYRGATIPWLDDAGEEFQCRRGIRMLLKWPTATDTNMAAAQGRLLLHNEKSVKPRKPDFHFSWNTQLD